MKSRTRGFFLQLRGKDSQEDFSTAEPENRLKNFTGPSESLMRSSWAKKYEVRR
jgi:hypothetical protein